MPNMPVVTTFVLDGRIYAVLVDRSVWTWSPVYNYWTQATVLIQT